MKIATIVFTIINLLLGVMGFIPLFMAGVMSMDSPQAQESLFAHIICYTILSFPIVCLICGLISNFCTGRLALIVSMFPIIEAILFITILYMEIIDV